jgi:tetratricopeptide (TPR) repeat protein
MIETSSLLMPEKKKAVVTKARNAETRMTKPQASRNPKTSDQGQLAANAAAVASGPKQLAAFEAAMKLFHARKLKEAREFFEQAITGPERDVAQRARLHMAMCDRRIGQPVVELGSAEDYYNYGVALINSRKMAEARSHLEKALEIAPGSDHIHYALALAQALAGELALAHEHLKRAIELEPRNRLIARQDADFAPIVNQPPFHALIYPEKKTW